MNLLSILCLLIPSTAVLYISDDNTKAPASLAMLYSFLFLICILYICGSPLRFCLTRTGTKLVCLKKLFISSSVEFLNTSVSKGPCKLKSLLRNVCSNLCSTFERSIPAIELTQISLSITCDEYLGFLVDPSNNCEASYIQLL